MGKGYAVPLTQNKWFTKVDAETTKLIHTRNDKTKITLFILLYLLLFRNTSMSSPNKAVISFKLDIYTISVGFLTSTYPTPRSRITSLVRTSNANPHQDIINGDI